MGSLTPKPNIRQIKIKFTSKGDMKVLIMLENEDSPVKKNR
jgi:hypothetical protein